MPDQCIDCEDQAVYECLGCHVELCADHQSSGLCMDCQGYTLRGNYNIDDVRVHGGEPKLIKEG